MGLGRTARSETLVVQQSTVYCMHDESPSQILKLYMVLNFPAAFLEFEFSQLIRICGLAVTDGNAANAYIRQSNCRVNIKDDLVPPSISTQGRPFQSTVWVVCQWRLIRPVD